MRLAEHRVAAAWADLVAREQAAVYDSGPQAGHAAVGDGERVGVGGQAVGDGERIGVGGQAVGDGERVGAGGSDAVMGEVAQVVAGLSRVNRWLRAAGASGRAVQPGVVGAVLEGLGRVDAVALAAVTRAVVLAEESQCAVADGQASPTEWVRARLRLSGRAAAQTCRLAAGLDGLPTVLAALEAGEISRDHAAGLVAADRQQRRDQEAAQRARRQAAAEAERQAAEQAAAAAAAAEAAADAAEAERLRQAAAAEAQRRQDEAEAAARAWAARAEQDRGLRQAALLGRARAGDDPDAVADRADRCRAADIDALARSEAAQRQSRSVRAWKDRESGAGRGMWVLPWEDHETLLALLDSLRTFDPAGTEPCEQRSFEQRQADALVDVIGIAAGAAAAPTSRGRRPQLHVTVPWEVLACGSELPGRTRYGTRLSAETVRRLSCDATLVRLVLDAYSQVLDVGRATRTWTAAQFAAAEHTFGGCAFPVADGRMCGRPAGWSELHHVWWWRKGGSTDQANGVLLCRRHHRAVHHDGWELEYDHAGQQVAVSRRRGDGSVCRRTVDLRRHHHDRDGQGLSTWVGDGDGRSRAAPEPGPELGRAGPQHDRDEPEPGSGRAGPTHGPAGPDPGREGRVDRDRAVGEPIRLPV